MRRRLTRILICLALGAVTTVGVAWGCAAFSDLQNGDMIKPVLVSFLGERYVVSIETEYGFGRRASGLASIIRRPEPGEDTDAPVQWIEAWGMVRQAPAPSFLGDRTPDLLIEYQELCGWPVLAMWCSTSDIRIHNNPSQTARTSSAIQFPFWLNANSPAYYDRQLPLRIIPWGFAIDTFLYAAIWFGLIVGFRTSRRALRRRRGRCPMCAYDLRGHTDPHPRPLSQRESGVRCPECGWNRAE